MRSSRVFCSFSFTVWSIFSRLAVFSARSLSRAASISARIFPNSASRAAMRAAFSFCWRSWLSERVLPSSAMFFTTVSKASFSFRSRMVCSFSVTTALIWVSWSPVSLRKPPISCRRVSMPRSARNCCRSWEARSPSPRAVSWPEAASPWRESWSSSRRWSASASCRRRASSFSSSAASSCRIPPAERRSRKTSSSRLTAQSPSSTYSMKAHPFPGRRGAARLFLIVAESAPPTQGRRLAKRAVLPYDKEKAAGSPAGRRRAHARPL